MALTVEGRRLTEAHRLLQTKIGAETAAQMIVAWRLLDPTRLDATLERWLQVATAAVQGQHAKSAASALGYLQAFRVVETGSEFRPVPAKPVSTQALQTSLTVTGPVSLKSATSRGVSLLKATDKALAGVAGAAMRHALDGGRQTIVGTVQADPQASGWARVTSGNACGFCSMLAGRGAVYSTHRVDFGAHDHCSCSAEPAYVGTRRGVRGYVPTTRNITEADRARVREWLKANPTAN